MKLKEQLALNRELFERFRDALAYEVLGLVKWSKPAFVSRVPGMRKSKMRIGIADCANPLVIVHNLDMPEISISLPDQVVNWPWPTVEAFPGLEDFLRKHATIPDGPVNIHTPGEAWIRKEKGQA